MVLVPYAQQNQTKQQQQEQNGATPEGEYRKPLLLKLHPSNLSSWFMSAAVNELW